MPSPVNWPGFLRQLAALEASWNTLKVRYPRTDAVPFLPLPLPQFVSLLTDAVMAAPTHWDKASGTEKQPTFLDVGCGTGTKIMLAEALYGLDGYGIDIVPRFISEAHQSKVKAELTDAFDFASYDHFDIVYVNRPSTLQDEMETLIMTKMAPEAVLLAANWRCSPADHGFEIVTMEYERPVCGVFRKPQR